MKYLFLLFFLLTGCAQADIVVTDDAGQTFRLAAPARRIVSLAPHATETLFAAGAGKAVVGTVQYSDYPEAAQRVPRIGGYSQLNLEAIAALKPDLVIAWASGNPPAQVDTLRSLGFKVFVSQPNRIEDVASQLERFGKLAGSEAVAEAAAASFRQRLEGLRRSYSGRSPVRVFYQIWKQPMMTVGAPQIITSAINLCGGDNVFGQLPQMAANVSVEAVLAANPEVIVAGGMGEARPEWLDDWNQWPRLLAVQRHNLFNINPDLIQRHTPRILDGTEQLCRDLEIARGRR